MILKRMLPFLQQQKSKDIGFLTKSGLVVVNIRFIIGNIFFLTVSFIVIFTHLK